MSSDKTAKVHFADNSQCVEFNTGCHSLLDCLEQQQYDIPFQCREGYCGACRATLSQGQVIYNEEPLAFVRDGEVLLCCCKPDGDITLSLK